MADAGDDARIELHRMDAELDGVVQSVWGDLEAVEDALEAAYQAHDGEGEASDLERGALYEAMYCVARAGVCLGWALVGVDRRFNGMRDLYFDAARVELRAARAWVPGLRLPRGLVGRSRAMLSLMGRYKRALVKAGVDDQLVGDYRPGEPTVLLTGSLECKGLGLGNVVVLKGKKPCR